MKNNIIQQITIDCLASKEQKKQMFSDESNYNKKDKKFYRRRILNLTKEMLLNNYSDELLWDVKESFNNYVKTCIGYFKIKDETDIIQEDYQDCLLDEITAQQLNESDDIVTPEEANKLMMRSIKLNKLPLDDFVTVIRMRPVKEIILPKQKEINLQDIKLKRKGILEKNLKNNLEKNLEKNNINKSYKDESETQRENIS